MLSVACSRGMMRCKRNDDAVSQGGTNARRNKTVVPQTEFGKPKHRSAAYGGRSVCVCVILPHGRDHMASKSDFFRLRKSELCKNGDTARFFWRKSSIHEKTKAEKRVPWVQARTRCGFRHGWDNGWEG